MELLQFVLLCLIWCHCYCITVLIVAGFGKADLKFPDSAGGYAYADSDLLDSTTRNRFIYWSVGLLIRSTLVQSIFSTHKLTHDQSNDHFQVSLGWPRPVAPWPRVMIDGIACKEGHLLFLCGDCSSWHDCASHRWHLELRDMIPLPLIIKLWLVHEYFKFYLKMLKYWCTEVLSWVKFQCISCCVCWCQENLPWCVGTGGGLSGLWPSRQSAACEVQWFANSQCLSAGNMPWCCVSCDDFKQRSSAGVYSPGLSPCTCKTHCCTQACRL